MSNTTKCCLFSRGCTLENCSENVPGGCNWSKTTARFHHEVLDDIERTPIPAAITGLWYMPNEWTKDHGPHYLQQIKTAPAVRYVELLFCGELNAGVPTILENNTIYCIIILTINSQDCTEAMMQFMGFTGFVSLPEGVSISEPFSSILPQTEIKLQVMYRPLLPHQSRFSLKCYTLHDQLFKIPCTARGLAVNVALSHNKVTLPGTALGNVSSVSTLLENKSENTISFQFLPPIEDDIIVTPSSGHLGPAESVRIQVDHAPGKPAPPKNRWNKRQLFVHIQVKTSQCGGWLKSASVF